jgi:hypothetical protein
MAWRYSSRKSVCMCVDVCLDRLVVQDTRSRYGQPDMRWETDRQRSTDRRRSKGKILGSECDTDKLAGRLSAIPRASWFKRGRFHCYGEYKREYRIQPTMRARHTAHSTPTFPVYSAAFLSPGELVLGGGGGASKTGITNKLVRHLHVGTRSCQ